MSDTRLVDEPAVPVGVNVATVPQRSPFRYPGGKTWLVPQMRRWLRSAGAPVGELVEPFAGGGIVGLTAAFEGLAQRVLLVELDENIASVWETMLGDDAPWLMEQIAGFVPSRESIAAVAERSHLSRRDRAFATLVRNRVSRGGILAPGAGIVKQGENGKGLASRWYPDTLIRRIREIHRHRDVLEFICGDGIRVMRDKAAQADTAFFVDPPYTVAGRRLYTHNDLDHRALFEVACRLSGTLLMTYDNTLEIRNLAAEHGLETREICMKTTHHRSKVELLVGRDFTWLGGP